jgi:hypothetical protein
MQWCLPCLRQHGGRLASASGPKIGAIGIQLMITSCVSAIVRFIAFQAQVGAVGVYLPETLEQRTEIPALRR